MNIWKDVGEVETREMKIITSQNKGKFFVGSSTRIQQAIKLMMKKDLKEKVNEQVARFSDVIPFNCIRNEEFA